MQIFSARIREKADCLSALDGSGEKNDYAMPLQPNKASHIVTSKARIITSNKPFSIRYYHN
jgi:hypothetical protein